MSSFIYPDSYTRKMFGMKSPFKNHNDLINKSTIKYKPQSTMKKLFKKLFKSFVISLLNEFAIDLKDEISSKYSGNDKAKDYAHHSMHFIDAVKNDVIKALLKK